MRCPRGVRCRCASLRAAAPAGRDGGREGWSCGAGASPRPFPSSSPPFSSWPSRAPARLPRGSFRGSPGGVCPRSGVGADSLPAVRCGSAAGGYGRTLPLRRPSRLSALRGAQHLPRNIRPGAGTRRRPQSSGRRGRGGGAEGLRKPERGRGASPGKPSRCWWGAKTPFWGLGPVLIQPQGFAGGGVGAALALKMFNSGY